jgi:hypothetical protein
MEIHKVTIRRHRDRKEIMAEEILVLLEFLSANETRREFSKNKCRTS